MNVENKNEHLELLVKEPEQRNLGEQAFVREVVKLAQAQSLIGAGYEPQTHEAAAVLQLAAVLYASQVMSGVDNTEAVFATIRTIVAQKQDDDAKNPERQARLLALKQRRNEGGSRGEA